MRVPLLIAVLLFAAVAVAGTRPSPPTFIVDTHGNPWFVRYVDHPEMASYGGVFVGFTDESSHEIRILDGMPLWDEQETLLHELCHVVIGTEHSNDWSSNHAWIYRTIPGLMDIFADNPNLVTYLGAQE